MSHYMGFDFPWVYMCQYGHFGHIFYFPCAPRAFQVRGLTCQVLDVPQPRGAIWSGQVISFPPGHSRGPFMTHFLLGGRVPRVHKARSPVPPRLPHFATPQSVRHLATVVAGAYPLRRPPDAWSPGLPTPPGPCYWLAASGTPMGWRRGCLAAGLVCSSVCYYCLGRCSALVVCAWRSRQVWGVGAGAGSCFFPRAPPCPRVPRGACCGLSRPGVPSLRLPVRHSMRSLHSPGSVWLPFGSAPPVRCVCVHPCSRDVRAFPPLRVGVARALCAVLVQGAVRAVPGGVSCSGPVLCLFGSWGEGPVPSSPCLAWGRAPPSGHAWSCVPALRAVGAAQAPGGGVPLAWVWGTGDWALSNARPPVLGACGRGLLPTHCACGGCGAGDPSPTPQRALLRAGFARCGGGRRVPRVEGVSYLGVGCPRLGALPRPTARPRGVRPGPTTHWL